MRQRYIEQQPPLYAGCYVQSIQLYGSPDIPVPATRVYPKAQFANTGFDSNSTSTSISTYVLAIREVAVHRIIFIRPTTSTATNLDILKPAAGNPVAFRITVDGTAGETEVGTTIELGGMRFPHGIGLDSAGNDGLVWAIVYDVIH